MTFHQIQAGKSGGMNNPEGYAFPGDPRQWEQTKYETAELSALGKLLLGLEKW